jgi:7-cyano-7-deazaguanine reductase
MRRTAAMKSPAAEPLDQGLTILKKKKAAPSRKLEAFPNRTPGRRYTVTLSCPEFTCVCPLTGQPDFGTITIHYIPDGRILESKSLKLYLWGFRDRATFAEAMAAEIADEIDRTARPHEVTVTVTQRPRGGIELEAVATRRVGGHNP